MWFLASLFACLTHMIFVEAVNTRLIPGPYKGRVEVYHNGSWGTVCNDDFDEADARVVCRSVGQPSMNAEVKQSATFGEGSGKIHLDDLECTGDETNLTYCNHRGWGIENCVHSEDVGVICQEVRLVPGPRSGRVEVYREGEWGTVCDDHFGQSDAEVVCRSLGLPTSQALNTTFGPGSGTIWMDNLNCTGRELSLFDCSHRGWRTHDCVHSEDAGVICHDGRAVRLVPGPSHGRVEVNYGGKWGTVCDDLFSDVDASVVCRSLGYLTENATSFERYGGGKDDIFLDDIACTGLEAILDHCENVSWGTHNCDHSEDVGVSCIYELPVRLVPGPTEGRVEVNFDGVWGTVCGDGFTYEDAKVVCRSLGLQTDFAEIAPMGYGSGRIWLDNVNCTGNESSLGFCEHLGFGVHNCEADKDVGVSCHTLAPTRLVPGPRAGRVEVYRRGVWGTVCDNQFTYNDAQVVCRSLGYDSDYAEVAPRGKFAYGLGTILLDKLGCSGSETSLSRCRHSGWGVTNCFHSNDVCVICHTSAPTRLVPGPRAGRVEVYRRGVWGTVCMDDFSYYEAQVVCRSLGLESDSINYYSTLEGLDTAWLSNISCNGNESSLSYCHYQERDSSNCHPGGYVWIMCHKVSVDIPPLRVYPHMEVNVHCSVTTTAEPPLNMIWKLGEAIVGNTSSLYRTFSKEANGEILRCQVFKNGKLIGKNHTVVNVYFPPPLITVESHEKSIGSNITLGSSCRCNPPPVTYSLIKNIYDERYLLLNSSMPPVFHNLTISDSGQYILMFRNWMNVTHGIPKFGLGARLVDVRIFYSPEVYCQETLNVLKGDEVNLTCHVDSFPLSTVQWSRSGKRLSNCSTLVLANIAETDADLYTCTANNTLMDFTNNFRPDTEVCSTRVNVLYPPQALAVSTKSVIEGYSANISLSVGSNPLPYVYELKKQNKNGSSITSILPPFISVVDRSDAGYYILKARNRMNITKAGVKEGLGIHLLKLRVLYPVKTRCLTVQYVLYNTSVNITCDVEALPAPDNITWTYLSKTHLGPHLLIENVQVSDNGVYTCTARNTMIDDRGFRRHSTSTCNTTLTVLYPPPTNQTGENPKSEDANRSRKDLSTVEPSR